MKRRYQALGLALFLSGAIVFGIGAYLKYCVFQPLGLAQEESAPALPFLLMADSGLRYALDNRDDPAEPDAVPPAEQDCAPISRPDGEGEGSLPDAATAQPDAADDAAPTAAVSGAETGDQDTAPPVAGKDWFFSVIPSQGAEDVSWYDDVLFIGDSRTCGLRDYARMGRADYFCSVGMTVFDVQEKKIGDANFSAQTLHSLLSQRSYGKIFISLGMNESGYPTDNLMRAYAELVDMVRAAQPDTAIILQGIMTVTEQEANRVSYLAISNLQAINGRIAALADGRTVYYIDVNEVVADERGYLPEGMSEDGCHLYAKYYQAWAEWIGYAAAQLGI